MTEPGPGDWDQLVLVGRVLRPHGLRGHVVVAPETDFVDERFAPGAWLWTRVGAEMRVLHVAEARRQGPRVIAAFTEFGRIDDVEPLAGAELRVPEQVLQPLEPGVYYQHQLIGCDVSTMNGQRLGTVVRVEGGAGNSRLIVNGDAGEIDVPLAVDICREIDPAARQIRIDPPEGLLDLNVTRRQQARRGARP